MNEQRNLILAIVLSVLVLLGWNIFYPQTPPPNKRVPQATQDNPQNNDSAEGADRLAIFSDASPTPATAISRDDILAQNPRLTIDNQRIQGSINLRGGIIDDLILKDYRQKLDDPAPIILFEPQASPRPYYAEFGWVGQQGQFPDRKSLWQSTDPRAILQPQQDISLFWENNEGIRFEKNIALDDNYLFTIRLKIINNSPASLSLAPYGLISRRGQPETAGFYILHEGLIGVIGDSLEEVDYDDILDETAIRQQSQGGWLGITDKYWLAAVIPDPKTEITASFQGKNTNTEPLFQSDFVTSHVILPAGQSYEYVGRLYAGAKETTLLDAYEKNYNIKNFDLAVDFGWFYFLTKPFYIAIHYLNNYLGNFGLAILALTVLVKIILLPLAYKSYASMSKMKLLQPQVMLLRERYGEDRKAMQEAMMELYRSEKVNPMSGCLPILLQIPVFFSLYKVLFVTIEMRHAEFYGWIYDLSAPDPLGILNLFGLIDWQIPNLLVVANIGLWPIIMGLTMWLQQRMNPSPPDPIQAKIFALMPFLFTFLLSGFPAGLVIYWAWNNTLSIAQQWFITRHVSAKLEARKKSSQKTQKTKAQKAKPKKPKPKKAKPKTNKYR